MSPKHTLRKQPMRKRGAVEENANPSRLVDNVEDVLDAEIAATRLREIKDDPEKLVSGEKLTALFIVSLSEAVHLRVYEGSRLMPSRNCQRRCGGKSGIRLMDWPMGQRDKVSKSRA